MSSDNQSFQQALSNALKKSEQKKRSGGHLQPLPSAIDLEQTVLGAILLEKDAFIEVAAMLSSKHFYSEEHAVIFEACEKMYEKGRPIDIVTIAESLRSSKQLEFVGGAYGLTQLTNRVGTAANIQYHARIIQEKFMAREIHKLGNSLISQSIDPSTDAFELADFTHDELIKIQNVDESAEPVSMSLAHKSAITDYEKPEKGSGLYLGVKHFDNVMKGAKPGNFIVVGARPGMGKSAFALCLAAATAANSIPVLFFSLEMTKEEMTERLLSNLANIPLGKITSKSMSEEQEQEFFSFDTSPYPIFFDDSASLNMMQISAKAKRMKRKHDIGAVFIDYLQLITYKGDMKGNKVHQISDISRQCKILAKALNVPVVALSQLSRGVESRENKRPLLSDLRESGAIEQDADKVLFLYRDEYYHPQESDYPSEDMGVMEIDFAKNRNGKTARTKAAFDGDYQRISNLNTY